MADIKDPTTWSTDALQRLVEGTIMEGRHPKKEYIAKLIEADKLSLITRPYAAAIVRGKRPGGRPKWGDSDTDVRMIQAICLICFEHNRAARDGEKITLTTAVDRAAKHGRAGFKKSSLWKMVTRYREKTGEDIF